MIIRQESQMEQADLERMMDAYGTALIRICFVYLKDLQLAEDAVQETFWRACCGYAKFRGNSSERTWLTSIACNVCRNMLRSSVRKQQTELSLEEDVPSEQKALDQDDTLLQEVQHLPSKYREVILLYYYQGFHVKEIAGILGTPVSTITVRMKRARKMLKERLGGWYYGT